MANVSKQIQPTVDPAERYRYCSREELHALVAPHAELRLADLGSGTGFFTDDIAPHVGTVYAVDVQSSMHDHYREKGVPDNVELVEADAGDLPLAADELDAAVSTMTFHEFADAAARGNLQSRRRRLAPDRGGLRRRARRATPRDVRHGESTAGVSHGETAMLSV